MLTVTNGQIPGAEAQRMLDAIRENPYRYCTEDGSGISALMADLGYQPEVRHVVEDCTFAFRAAISQPVPPGAEWKKWERTERARRLRVFRATEGR